MDKVTTMNCRIYGYVYALGSGIWAALASIFSKLMMDRDVSRTLVSWIIVSKLKTTYDDRWIYVVRALSLLSVIMSNIFMWTWFTKALGYSRSSVQASVMNTAANVIVAALLGSILFGEPLSKLWWIGASLMILGVVWIQVGNSTYEQQVSVKREIRKAR